MSEIQWFEVDNYTPKEIDLLVCNVGFDGETYMWVDCLTEYKSDEGYYWVEATYKNLGFNPTYWSFLPNFRFEDVGCFR